MYLSNPGNANLPIGDLKNANRENGVPNHFFKAGSSRFYARFRLAG